MLPPGPGVKLARRISTAPRVRSLPASPPQGWAPDAHKLSSAAGARSGIVRHFCLRRHRARGRIAAQRRRCRVAPPAGGKLMVAPGPGIKLSRAPIAASARKISDAQGYACPKDIARRGPPVHNEGPSPEPFGKRNKEYSNVKTAFYNPGKCKKEFYIPCQWEPDHNLWGLRSTL